MPQLLDPPLPRILVFHPKRENFLRILRVSVKALLFPWSEIHLS